jgi:hypothetical protein
MLSRNECDARFASHHERIARVERASRLASSSFVCRRRRGTLAKAAILSWAPSRAGAALIVVGRWFAGERVVEVG